MYKRQLLEEASRPIIIAGGGILCAGAWDELRRLAELEQIPVANTLMGLGSIDLEHPLALGMMGVHGLSAANRAVQQSDLVIALGARFSDRMTCRVDGFAPLAKIVHIDVDPAEIGKNVRVNVPIVGDLKIVLNQILEKLEPADGGTEAGDAAKAAAPVPESRGVWLAEIARLKHQGRPGSRQKAGLSPIAAGMP